MYNKPLLPPEIKAAIGVEIEYAPPIEVEEEAIRRYAETIIDKNRLYHDENYARSHGYSGVLAPPMFLCGFPPISEFLPGLSFEFTGLHVKDDWEFFYPVQSGDTISRKGKLLRVREKLGRSGPMTFVTVEVKFTNQRGELVAIYRPTSMLRLKPGAK